MVTLRQMLKEQLQGVGHFWLQTPREVVSDRHVCLETNPPRRLLIASKWNRIVLGNPSQRVDLNEPLRTELTLGLCWVPAAVTKLQQKPFFSSLRENL